MLPSLLAACSAAALTPIAAAAAPASAQATRPLTPTFYQWIVDLHPSLPQVNDAFKQTTPLNFQIAPVQGFGIDRFVAEARDKSSTWDVYVGMTPFVEMSALIQADVIEPWDNYIPQDVLNDMIPSIRHECTVDGKLYSWPFLLDIITMGWNKGQSDQAGIADMPTTWTQLLADSQQVVTSKAAPYGVVFDAHGWRPIPLGTILRHVVLVGFMLMVLLPLAWVLLLSIKSIPDAYRPGFWPEHFDFTHYTYAITNIPTLARNLLNSIVVTTLTVVITTACAVMGGYALVHLHLRGRAIVLGLMVASLFFPTRVTSLIAIFEIQRSLGLINTTLGLVLPYVTLNLALSVFIMRGIFEQISHELVDAARIDGAGAWRTLLSVLLPLTRNGIVVVIIVNFVSAWGEYLLGVTLTNDQEVRTLPVVLAGAFGGMGQWAWPRIAAVYVMAVAPGLAAFAFSQRWYMQGLQEGALKY